MTDGIDTAVLEGTGQKLLKASDRAREQERMYASRKRVNQVALSLSLAAMMFGLVWLVWILWDTVRLGVGGLTWATVSQMTPPPNEAGGIANALYGSFLMVMLATFVATRLARPVDGRGRFLTSSPRVRVIHLERRLRAYLMLHANRSLV